MIIINIVSFCNVMLPVATYKSRDTPKPFVVWRTKQGHVVVVFNKIWQENIWPNCFKFINLRDFGGWMPNPNHRHLGWQTGWSLYFARKIWSTQLQFGDFYGFLASNCWLEHGHVRMEASAQINHDTLSYAYSTGGPRKTDWNYVWDIFHQADFSGFSSL